MHNPEIDATRLFQSMLCPKSNPFSTRLQIQLYTIQALGFLAFRFCRITFCLTFGLGFLSSFAGSQDP